MISWEEEPVDVPAEEEMLEEQATESSADDDFYAENLVEQLSDANLKKLAEDLLQSIDEDIASRREWIETAEKAEKYLGYGLEDTNVPFSQANRTYDLTLSTTLMRYYATTRAELLPNTGVAGFQLNGPETDELIKRGELERDWINYYLTVVDKGFYPDYERFLLYLGFYGSVCRKIYLDPFTRYPISRFIAPKDFIINNDCTSVLESDRITHRLYLSKREILLNQQNGIYRDIDLTYLKPGQNVDDDDDDNKDKSNSYTKKTLFTIYECHVYLNLDEYNDSIDKNTEKTLPLPYIVTIDKISRDILAIRRNWAKDDEEFKRINYFIHYTFCPSFGIHGNGLAHQLGSSAITMTRALNQLLDAATFKNLPAGLRAKGFKQQQNDLIIGPGEFKEVDTGGIPLKEAFMPLPYSEPSVVLKELLLIQREQTKELSATTEMGMFQSKEDISTGTALAMLEERNKLPSAILKSLHMSFSEELQLLSKLFRNSVEYEEFYLRGEKRELSAEDFSEQVAIIPVSDPSVNSSIQRMYRAESIFRLAQQAPEMHDMHEVYKMVYKAQGIDEEQIDKLLKPEPQPEEVMPLDPSTENINMLLGKPAQTAIWQEHSAHKIIHGMFAAQHSDNQELQASIMAHIKEHEAQEYLIQQQQLLGAELPPLETLQNPEVQNAIAMAIAEKLDQQMTNEQMQAQQSAIDSNALLMEDIKQKQQDTEAKERIAKLKAETDVFKAQLDFEIEKAKINSNEDIAELKAETELTKAEENNQQNQTLWRNI